MFNDERMSLSRRTLLGGSLAAAALALAGCRSAATNSQATGRLTVGIPTDVAPPNFLRRVQANFPVRALVFDTLIALDLQSRRLVPRVATAWNWNADQTVLTLKLREDVKFHTGRPFGPQDVKFSLDQAGNKANRSQLAPVAKYIKSVEQSGPAEATITLTSPISNFLDLLLVSPIVDSETIGDLKSGKRVVGTGPFTWKSWTAGNQLELAKNPDYWEGSEPYVDSVTLRVFTQGQALAAALRTNAVDVAYQMVPRDAAQFRDDDRYQVLSFEPSFTDWYLGLNITAAPLTDIRVRQAIAWAIDRERIAKQVFSGFGTPSCLPALDSFPGLTPADNTRYTYDPAKAKQLLRAAGAVGASIPIVNDAENQTSMAIRNIVQYDLEQAGLKVVPTTLDSAAYQTQLQEAAIGGAWVGAVDQSSISIATMAIGSAPLKAKENTSRVTDPAYAELVDGVVGAATEEAKATANRAYVDYLFDQAFHITLGHGFAVAVMRKSLTGAAITGTSELDLSGAK